MPTNYPYGTNSSLGPNGYDDFLVTSKPEDTPLSQAGQGGNRNHVQSHTDMGDAIEALEAYAALRTHDHSGDPNDRSKGDKLAWSNAHQAAPAPASLAAAQAYADTDDSATAIHHTLGTNLPASGTTGQYQAAPANHTHLYSTLVNAPLQLCTSTTRPAGSPLGTMIYESDTNRMRVWGQFGTTNTAVVGINNTDNFDRTSTTSLGGTLWSQIYTPGSQGKWGTDGDAAKWYDEGNDPARCIARRVNSDGTPFVTNTGNQIITWQVKDKIESYLPFSGGTPASNDMYFRMNSDATGYLRLKFSWDEWGRGTIALLGTRTGPAGEQMVSSLSSTKIGYDDDTYWTAQLIGNTVTVWYGPNLEGSSTLVGTLVDASNVGPQADEAGYRGWGIGVEVGNRQFISGALFNQVTPASLDMVNIQDVVYYSGTPIWQLLPVAQVPVLRLRQSINQQISSTGTFLQWGEEVEDTFDFFNVTNPTAITVKEPGLYHLNVALQWNTSAVPENGTVLAVVNNTDTDLMATAYQKIGTSLNPTGFHQTLALSGKIRLAANDTLKIKVKTSNTGLLQFLSFFDRASKVNSRLDLIFVSP